MLRDSPSIILIDKPSGWTSHDVVAFYRKKLGIKKIGHTGTLDPLATGLLILLIGQATKRQAEFQRLDKEYITTALLGFTSDTYDIEGQVRPVTQILFERTPHLPEGEGEVEKPKTSSSPQFSTRQKRGKASSNNNLETSPLKSKPSRSSHLPTIYLTPAQIKSALEKFRGAITQTVPPFSAVKIKGQRLYHRARRGTLHPRDLPRRRVEIYDLQLLKIENQPLSAFQPPGFIPPPIPTISDHPSPSRCEDSHLEGGLASGLGGVSSPASRSAKPSLRGAHPYNLHNQSHGKPRGSKLKSSSSGDNLVFLTLKVRCSSGTYIRSLVHDLGQVLATGAIVTSLRRTRVGEYKVENATKLFP